MLQPMLLLVEVILVLGAGYICWMTRRQMLEMRDQMAVAAGGSDPQSAAGRMGQIDTMNDLADVLADLRSNINEMRSEWQREKETLRQQLEQAEKTVAEMRAQVVQARVQTPIQPATSIATARPGAQATGFGARPAMTGLTLGDGLGLFADHLRASGMSESTIKGIAGPVRQFALWFGGQRHQQVEMCVLDPCEVERFVAHLYRRHQNLNTIRRKAAAVRRFLIWSRDGTLEIANVKEPAQIQPDVVPVAVHSAEATPGTCEHSAQKRQFRPVPAVYSEIASFPVVGDRRQIVLSLAHQGVDAATIAARVGLDRETVRMLLATRDDSQPGRFSKDRLAIPIGAVFPHPATHIMHQASS